MPSGRQKQARMHVGDSERTVVKARVLVPRGTRASVCAGAGHARAQKTSCSAKNGRRSRYESGRPSCEAHTQRWPVALAYERTRGPGDGPVGHQRV